MRICGRFVRLLVSTRHFYPKSPIFDCNKLPLATRNTIGLLRSDSGPLTYCRSMETPLMRAVPVCVCMCVRADVKHICVALYNLLLEPNARTHTHTYTHTLTTHCDRETQFTPDTLLPSKCTSGLLGILPLPNLSSDDGSLCCFSLLNTANTHTYPYTVY